MRRSSLSNTRKSRDYFIPSVIQVPNCKYLPITLHSYRYLRCRLKCTAHLNSEEWHESTSTLGDNSRAVSLIIPAKTIPLIILIGIISTCSCSNVYESSLSTDSANTEMVNHFPTGNNRSTSLLRNTLPALAQGKALIGSEALSVRLDVTLLCRLSSPLFDELPNVDDTH